MKLNSAQVSRSSKQWHSLKPCHC